MVIRSLEKESKGIRCNDSVLSLLDGVDRTKEDSKLRTYWACHQQPEIILDTKFSNKLHNQVYKNTLRWRKKPSF